MVGQPLPADACPDSFDVLPALLGKSDAKGRDHILQQPNKGPTLALRVGDWKVLSYASAKPHKKLTYEKGEGKYELYNLADDPGEAKNLATSRAERLESMRKRLDQWKASMEEPRWGESEQWFRVHSKNHIRIIEGR